MIKDILLSSYQKILDDHKLVKLTLATSITHSLIFVVLAIYNTYFFFENKFQFNTSNQVIKYILWLFDIQWALWKIVAIGILLFLGYFVLSPIWDSMVISHLDWKTRVRSNIQDGIKYYYKMVEYDTSIALFNFILFFSMFSKLFVYNIANGLVLSVMAIRFFAIVFVFLFLQYTKYIIIFEQVKVGEAIKQSITYSLENITLTTKLVIASVIVNFRLILNLIFMIGVPILLIYILHSVDLLWSLHPNVVYVIFFGIIVFLAYINSLVDAYFKTYRYQAYLKVSWKDATIQDKELDIYKDNLFDIKDNPHTFQQVANNIPL